MGVIRSVSECPGAKEFQFRVDAPMLVRGAGASQLGYGPRSGAAEGGLASVVAVVRTGPRRRRNHVV